MDRWFENYKKYIKFQCEVLIHAYEYGGMKFKRCDVPTFEEFEKALSDNKRNYENKFFATDYYNKNGILNRTFTNQLNQPIDGALYRISYSWFKGVVWNRTLTMFDSTYKPIIIHAAGGME